ncbi:MAG: hypothetical protein ACK2T6_07705, partial [Anaerolineae bacterium]
DAEPDADRHTQCHVRLLAAGNSGTYHLGFAIRNDVGYARPEPDSQPDADLRSERHVDPDRRPERHLDADDRPARHSGAVIERNGAAESHARPIRLASRDV